MAIQWGARVYNGSQWFALGVDLSHEGGTTNGGITVSVVGYIQTSMSVSDSNNTLNVSGSLTWSGARPVATSGQNPQEIFRGSYSVPALSLGQSFNTVINMSLSGLEYFGTGTTAYVTRNATYTRPATVPGAPGKPTFSSITTTSATATCTAAAANGSAITAYRWHWSTDPAFGTYSWGETAGTSRSITGLRSNTTYFVQLNAINGVGPGPSPATANFKTLAAKPNNPSALSASRTSDTAVALAWTSNPFDAGSPVVSTLIDQSLDGGTTWTRALTLGNVGAATAQTAPNRATRYRVQQSNSAGSSAWVVFPGTIYTTPGAPTGIAVTRMTGNGATITWANTCSYATGIRVERSLNGGAWALLTTLGPTATTHTDAAAPAGQTLRYRVRAELASPALQSAWLESPVMPVVAGAPTWITEPTARRCTVTGVTDPAGTYLLVHAQWQSDTTVTSSTVRYRRAGTTPGAWSSTIAVTNNTAAVIGGGSIGANDPWEIEWSITNTLGRVLTMTVRVQPTKRLFHAWAEKMRLGLGKLGEKDNTLQIALDTEIMGGLAISKLASHGTVMGSDVANVYADTSGRLYAIANTEWLPLAPHLESGWTSRSDLPALVRIYNGFICFRGIIIGNTSANTSHSVMTLPVQFRAGGTSTAIVDTGANLGYASIHATNGVMSVRFTTAVNARNVVLDGITPQPVY